jgi:hypothetical protein
MKKNSGQKSRATVPLSFVCFGCFDTSPKHQNKPKKFFLLASAHTEKQPKQIEFWFVLVRTEKIDYFEDTLLVKPNFSSCKCAFFLKSKAEYWLGSEATVLTKVDG